MYAILKLALILLSFVHIAYAVTFNVTISATASHTIPSTLCRLCLGLIILIMNFEHLDGLMYEVRYI